MKNELNLEDLEALYRSRFADFVRTASAITGSREAGFDATHDAFVSAVRARKGFRHDGTPEAWVWKLVVNAALKRRRRHRQEEPRDIDLRIADGIWTESYPNDDAATSVVRQTVAALPERQRLILFLRYYADLDYAAIAEVTGARPGTVAATLTAARSSIRKELEEVQAHGHA